MASSTESIGRSTNGTNDDGKRSSDWAGLWSGRSPGRGLPRSFTEFVRLVTVECSCTVTFDGQRDCGVTLGGETGYAGTNSTPLSTTALSREGATTLPRNRPPSFHTLTCNVSPG